MAQNHGTLLKNVGLRCPNCFSKLKKGRKFCSKQCYWIKKVGTKQSNKHKYNISKSLLGKKKSVKHVKNASFAHTGMIHQSMRGENHPFWKGNNAKKGTIHDWLYYHYGAPKKCESCGIIKSNNKRIHWANKSQEYKRDRSDWIRLCVQCHSKYDHEHPKSKYNKNKC